MILLESKLQLVSRHPVLIIGKLKLKLQLL